MTTHRTHVVLAGSNKSGGLLQTCCRCMAEKPPEGGVNVTTSKWYCFHCWRAIQQRSRKCMA